MMKVVIVLLLVSAFVIVIFRANRQRRPRDDHPRRRPF
jgi:hypothetical protein